MGNQQPVGRARSDTYSRYEREGEDGRYVTMDPNEYNGSPNVFSTDDRVGEKTIRHDNRSCLCLLQLSPRHDSSLPMRIRHQRQQNTEQFIQAETQNEKKTIPVVFKYPASPRDKEVLLTGSFTNWKDTIAMVKR
jgi:hypothetical protein